MSEENLRQELEGLPVKWLHRLARGRIHRHFRLGRQRLIELLLTRGPEEILAIRAELAQLASRSNDTSTHSHPRDRSFPPSFESKRAKGLPASPKKGPPVPETQLTQILDGIGIPDPQPFVPDHWQTEAVEHIAQSDVIVSAPTGSGKTYVALEAIKQAMDLNQTIIYTSPLKALSNTKFMEFSQLFGPDQVGILTGDRRDNAQAPLLIMTTEILRNLLYDAASGEIDLRLNTLGLVILDESQYLADPERGVVWEETLILCPAQAKLLLLSASIGNPQDLAQWLTSIRPTTCHLVQHGKRSVPLRGLFLHPNSQLVPLFRTQDIRQGKGYHFHTETKRLIADYETKPFH